MFSRMKPQALFALSLLALSLLSAGCESQPPSPALHAAYNAYHRGNYSESYGNAKAVADASIENGDAAYLAGLSAYQLKQSGEAERYLLQATRAANLKTSGDAHAMLGRIYAEQGRHERAVENYAIAASRLSGDERANALLFLAQSQQHLGQWPQAGANLNLARQATQNPEVLQRIAQQQAVTGWTLQVGAYTTEINAQRAAQDLATKTSKMSVGSPRLVPAVDSGGKRLILVQVGTFTNQAGASAAKGRIAPHAAVVPMMAAK